MVRHTHFILVALVMALIGFTNLPAAAQTGRTFYIDYDNGSNSNSGTSKASPWKTHPYMQTSASCTGSGAAPSYTHLAGDQFIFKGGVTWPVACFAMTIPAGGVSGNPDYYGVDKTWYTGGSWSMPLFDMAQSTPTGRHVIVVTSAFPGYATFDGFEIANQQVPLGISNADDAYNFAAVGTPIPGVLIENGYIHDWISNTDVHAQSSSFPWPYSAGAIYDGHDRITVDHMVIEDDGGWVYNGATKVVGGYSGACVNCSTVSNTTFHDIGAACFTVASCHDNEIYHVKQDAYDLCACRPHSQAVEDDEPSGTSSGGWMYVYNNLIHDNPYPAGVSIYVPYNDYVYNNVIWNSHQNILLTSIANDSSSKAGYIYNNIVDCSDGSHCLARDTKGAQLGTVYATNNIWITNGTPTCFSGTCSNTTLVQTTNYTMSTSEASTYGFTRATKYAPTSSDSQVTSAGTNLSNRCSAELALLCQDAQGAAWYGGSYQTRPLDSTAWTMGAYVFGGQSQSSKPSPPTNLTASVQ